MENEPHPADDPDGSGRILHLRTVLKSGADALKNGGRFPPSLGANRMKGSNHLIIKRVNQHNIAAFPENGLEKFNRIQGRPVNERLYQDQWK
jgi:hypothetical protein